MMAINSLNKGHMISTLELFHKAEDYFFSGIAQKCLELDKIAKAYMTGVPVASLNPVYIKTKCNLTEVIKKSHIFYPNRYPFEIIIPKVLCTPNIKRDLKKLGYIQIANSTSMVTSLIEDIDYGDNNGNEFTIQLDQSLKDWIIPMIDAFESTFEMTLLYAKTHEHALMRGFRFEHFCLYTNKQPISSLTLSMHGNIARIDDVATLPIYQGKGYATHLIKHALSEAKKAGSAYCFLESSTSGLSIYEKLGFSTLSSNNVYSKL